MHLNYIGNHITTVATVALTARTIETNSRSAGTAATTTNGVLMKIVDGMRFINQKYFALMQFSFKLHLISFVFIIKLIIE